MYHTSCIFASQKNVAAYVLFVNVWVAFILFALARFECV